MSQEEKRVGFAIAKGIRLSPKRARSEAVKVVKCSLLKSLDHLFFTSSKSAKAIYKVVKSAASNLESKHGVRMSDMILNTLQVDEGRKLKRGKARNKGRTSPILKPTVHIKAVVIPVSESVLARTEEKE